MNEKEKEVMVGENILDCTTVYGRFDKATSEYSIQSHPRRCLLSSRNGPAIVSVPHSVSGWGKCVGHKVSITMW